VVFLALLVVLIVVVFFPANPAQQLQHPEQYMNLSFLNNTVIAGFLHTVHSYILPTGWSLIAANGIGESMEIYFVASIIVTLLIIMPVIAYETYKFVDPALKAEERNLIYPFVTSTTILFAVGTLFGYFVLAKFLVLFLAPFFQAASTSYLVDAASFYFVIFLIIGATGVSFTAPVFVYALIKLRVLQPEFFSKNRLLIWFAVWIVTGLFLTPDGGPLLDLVIFLPIITLVEFAVWLGGRSVRSNPPPPKPKCEFCGSELSGKRPFCQNCGKAVR
jgi:Sec-independent protein secretion pathway component TatC